MEAVVVELDMVVEPQVELLQMDVAKVVKVEHKQQQEQEVAVAHPQRAHLVKVEQEFIVLLAMVVLVGGGWYGRSRNLSRWISRR